jgi:hypothetical protein
MILVQQNIINPYHNAGLPFWGMVVCNMSRGRQYLAVLIAIVLAASGLAGCLSDNGNGETKWAKPVKVMFDDLEVDEANQMVYVNISLGDANDRYTRASGTLRVAVFDSDGLEMLNKTFDVAEKEFEVIDLIIAKITSFSVEIPFADFTKSHDRGYGLLDEEGTMYGMVWFDYKGTALTDTYDWGWLNPDIPDDLLHPNEDPVADLTGPTTGFTGIEVSFDASGSTDLEEGDLDFEWDWGDGDTTTFLAEDVETHTYDEAGTFTVMVTVEDPEDATGTKSMDITIAWAIAVTVDEWGTVVSGEKINQTYVTVTIDNMAGVEVDVPILDAWIIDPAVDPVGSNGTDATWPTTMAADADATIMIYFDVPTGFAAATVKIMGREFSLS